MGQIRQYTGEVGEKIAAKFLKSRKFIILEKNFVTPLGEIDLIAEHKGFLVFIEVKTRTTEWFGPPLSAIDSTKKRHIIRNCLYYLKRYGRCHDWWRIDAIGINLDKDGKLQVLRHVKNAIEVEED